MYFLPAGTVHPFVRHTSQLFLVLAGRRACRGRVPDQTPLRSPQITHIVAPLALFPFVRDFLLTPIPASTSPDGISATGWPLVISICHLAGCGNCATMGDAWSG